MASIFFRTLVIYFLLSFTLRIMGKRQIGELEVSELVSTLLISEISALPIADPDIPILNAVIPLLLILALEIIISSLKNKSESLKKLVEGEPIFLIYKGKISEKALKDNRLSVNELLCEARLQGVGDINDINYAILEQNGQISILKKGKEKIAIPILIDGELREDTLKDAGISKNSVLQELDRRKLSKEKILLMTSDENKKFNIYLKEENDS